MVVIKIVVFLFLVANLAMGRKRKPNPWPPVVTAEKGNTYKSIYVGTGSLKYYSFNGIRYGHLINRFSAPAPVCHKSLKACNRGNPNISRSRVSEYQVKGSPKCSQAIPNWLKTPSENPNERRDSESKYTPKIVPDNEVEDCLFLDILIPEKVWNQTHSKGQGLAPVLFWIHDGGFTSGDRGLKENPGPLLSHTLELHEEGMIVVSINYRLGLFGFLSGGGKNIASNAGLIDQRMALGWVQKHISKFGGDRSRVTVMGEGAGAASIMHHLTAPNITNHFFPNLQSPSHHKYNFPFQSAILQSPSFQPIPYSQSKLNFAKVLAMASKIAGQKVNTVAKLRVLPYQVLYAVNVALVEESPSGTFTFGPTVDYVKGDRSYVPDFPLRRLSAGIMAKGVNILVGYRRNGGYFYTHPILGIDDGLKSHLAKIFPTIPEHHLAYISNSLYPSLDYENLAQGEVTRITEVLNDIFVVCNVHYLLKSFRKSYGYFLDKKWDFWSNFTSKMTVHKLQDQLLRFIMFIRHGARAMSIRNYEGSGKVLNVSDTELHKYIKDPTAKNQCQFWANTPFDEHFFDVKDID